MIHYTWTEFERDVRSIVHKVRESQVKYTSVYTFPRGGLPLGVCLSHSLGIPLLIHGKDTPEKNSLVVDEITDKGKTLESFWMHDIVVIHRHLQSRVKLVFWLHDVVDWVRYPWEIDNVEKH